MGGLVNQLIKKIWPYNTTCKNTGLDITGSVCGSQFFPWYFTKEIWERSGSVVECLTRDRRVAGSSLTGVTALWSLSKTHLS